MARPGVPGAKSNYLADFLADGVPLFRFLAAPRFSHSGGTFKDASLYPLYKQVADQLGDVSLGHSQSQATSSKQSQSSSPNKQSQLQSSSPSKPLQSQSSINQSQPQSSIKQSESQSKQLQTQSQTSKEASQSLNQTPAGRLLAHLMQRASDHCTGPASGCRLRLVHTVSILRHGTRTPIWQSELLPLVCSFLYYSTTFYTTFYTTTILLSILHTTHTWARSDPGGRGRGGGGQAEVEGGYLYVWGRREGVFSKKA